MYCDVGMTSVQHRCNIGQYRSDMVRFFFLGRRCNWYNWINWTIIIISQDICANAKYRSLYKNCKPQVYFNRKLQTGSQRSAFPHTFYTCSQLVLWCTFQSTADEICATHHKINIVIWFPVKTAYRCHVCKWFCSHSVLNRKSLLDPFNAVPSAPAVVHGTREGLLNSTSSNHCLTAFHS